MCYVFLILLQSTIFALVDVFAKMAYKVVPFACFQTLRFVIATSAAFIFNGKKIINDYKSAPVKEYIVPAICMGLAVNVCTVSLSRTPATTYSFIRNMNAIITPLLMTIFYGRKYKSYDFILQTALIAGLYLLCAKGGLSKFGLGEILAVAVAILLSCSIVFGQHALEYVSTETLSASQFICGLVFSLPLGIISGQFASADWSLFLRKDIIFFLLFNSIVGAFIGYLLQNIALKHISAKVVGIIQSSYPVATATFAAILLGEHLSPTGLIGAGIITAVVVVQSFLKEEPAS